MNDTDITKLSAYRLKAAKATIKEAELLIDNKMWNAAVNRIYYACFYAVNALLIRKQIQARKHSGVIQMFNLHFIHTGLLSKEYGKFYTTHFDMRQSGDYMDHVDFKEEDVAPLSDQAKDFINRIGQYLSNNS